MIRKFILWILIILWMSVIFSLSNQEATQSKKVSSGVIKTVVRAFDFNESLSEAEIQKITENFTFIVRKGAHFSAYALLSILIALLLNEYKIFKVKQFLITLVIAFLYACSDEYHQTFIKGRSGEIRDVLIDVCGAVAGMVFLWSVLAIKKRCINNASANS